MSRRTHPHEISFSPTLRRLMLELQTQCTADCCKGSAFRVSDALVCRWLNGERIDRYDELAEEIEKIELIAASLQSKIRLSARHLESEWPLDEFRDFWRGFATAFRSAKSAFGREDVKQYAAPDSGHTVPPGEVVR